MKLRNKKTGEIKEVEPITIGGFRSLAELNEVWEDVPEEPKEYWCIDWTEPGGVYKATEGDIWCDFNKEIGNYFNTREEAEKTVERLRAWKRLKDKGFKLKGWYMPKSTLKIEIDGGFPEDVSLCDVMDDLDIIFGGEE